MTVDDLSLPIDKMKMLINDSSKIYRENTPFPHIVLDDFFDEKSLNEILHEFPSPKAKNWTEYKGDHEIKLESKFEQDLGKVTRNFIYLLNSPAFLNFLEALTGIHNLIPDPHLEGGGLHQILAGGKLGIHADFNKHEFNGLDRRLNLLIYLNKDWEESYQGHLELWDKDVTRCEKKLLPVFNRMVIFNTNSDSFHGHPEPLACPEGRSRKSIALYYYTNGRPEEEMGSKHYTVFQSRPNEYVKPPRLKTIKKTVRKFVPPILYELKDWIKK